MPAQDENMNFWYVLHTKPNRERQVAVQMYQRGLTVYLPLVWVNPVSQRAARERPFFPSYLFARLDAGPEEMGTLRWAPGVSELLEMDGEPCQLSERFIEELRQHLERVRTVSGLDPGQPGGRAAPITQGLFAGYEGAFDLRLSPAARTHCLLACIQREYWRIKQAARRGPGFPDGQLASNGI
jgi:transcriptional antiterminator RfaH